MDEEQAVGLREHDGKDNPFLWCYGTEPLYLYACERNTNWKFIHSIVGNQMNKPQQ